MGTAETLISQNFRDTDSSPRNSSSVISQKSTKNVPPPNSQTSFSNIPIRWVSKVEMVYNNLVNYCIIAFYKMKLVK